MVISRVNLIVAGLVGVALGVFVGLGVSLLTGQSYADLSDERDRLQTAVRDLRQEADDAEETGSQSRKLVAEPDGLLAERDGLKTTVEELARATEVKAMIGSGSPIHEVALGFEKAGLLPSFRPWVVLAQYGYFAVHLDLFNKQSQGHLFIEAIVGAIVADGTAENGIASVELIFRPRRVGDLDQCLVSRNQAVIATARILEFSDEELARLEGVLKRLPIARPAAIRAAMTQFVELAPQAVQDRFADCLFHSENPGARLPAGILAIGGYGPAIGMTLSDRWLMDVVFAASGATLLLGDSNQAELGPWWSIVLQAPQWADNTSVDWRKEGAMVLHWPRLSAEEVQRTFSSSR